MPFFDHGAARLHYRDEGAGPPLFIIYGGGLDSSVEFERAPFDAFAAFRDEYRCFGMDLRSSTKGRSEGSLDAADPWGMFTADHLALLAHLDVDRFLVMGFCIGNPLIWNLMQAAPGRIVAAVSAQPSAVDPANPDCFYTRNLAKWAPTMVALRPDLTMEDAEAFLAGLYKDRDFVITASRNFVAGCEVPLLVLPDDTVSHPYSVAIEMARLAPRGQQSFFPWKDEPGNVAMALRHVHTFLRAHRGGLG